MGNFLKFLPKIIFFVFCTQLIAQSAKQHTYVIVHGAWGGGWAFKGVDSLLTSHDAQVYRPTLTGLGERSHLASTGIGLNTHINDIVNTILFEELQDVILVGHSYSGMVITGVADKVPERIRKMVYIDAVVPKTNESAKMILGPLTGGQLPVKDGHIIPAWVKEGTLPPVDMPHPQKTWSDPIVLRNQKRLEIPTTYILTVEKDTDPQLDHFASQAKRAREYGWTVQQLEADHNPQWSHPKELVQLLLEIAK